MAYQFSPETEKKFQWLLTRYPKKDAILLPLLRKIQIEEGWLRPDIIDYVASRMDLSPARIREVASFYTMFRLNKKGQYVLGVCQTMSCYLRGCDQLISHLQKTLGIQLGETTADGLFTLEAVECLGSCGTAPAMQVNEWDYHEELDIEKLDKIIEALRSHKWASPSYEERVKQGGVA